MLNSQKKENRNIAQMRVLFLFSLFQIFSLGLFSQSTVKCVIATEKGKIIIELYPEKAPETVTNFMRYVDNSKYDNTSFFRVCTPENESKREIKIEVIQGGDVEPIKQYEPIKIETTKHTGLTHENGTLSMARDTPNSATSGFFICINKQPELDFGGKRNTDGYGFAAFGKVTRGMRVVRNIQKLENEKQMLIKPVTINYIRRLN